MPTRDEADGILAQAQVNALRNPVPKEQKNEIRMVDNKLIMVNPQTGENSVIYTGEEVVPKGRGGSGTREAVATIPIEKGVTIKIPESAMKAAIAINPDLKLNESNFRQATSNAVTIYEKTKAAMNKSATLDAQKKGLDELTKSVNAGGWFSRKSAKDTPRSLGVALAYNRMNQEERAGFKELMGLVLKKELPDFLAALQFIDDYSAGAEVQGDTEFDRAIREID